MHNNFKKQYLLVCTYLEEASLMSRSNGPSTIVSDVIKPMMKFEHYWPNFLFLLLVLEGKHV